MKTVHTVQSFLDTFCQNGLQILNHMCLNCLSWSCLTWSLRWSCRHHWTRLQMSYWINLQQAHCQPCKFLARHCHPHYHHTFVHKNLALFALITVCLAFACLEAPTIPKLCCSPRRSYTSDRKLLRIWGILLSNQMHTDIVPLNSPNAPCHCHCLQFSQPH